MKTYTSNWNYPTQIRFGCGRINEIMESCQELDIQHPLVVSDPNLAQLPLFNSLTKHLNKYTVFTDIKPNPVKKNVEDGVSCFEKNGCDGVIAIGGGSALDSAKTIAVMIGQSEDLWVYEDIGNNFKKLNSELFAPLIAIPTTSGTGSEVGRAAVIIDETQHAKRFIFHPQMIPNTVIADPELTVGLPSQLTAATGMDALAHNLEAYCATGYHPMADGVAMEGIRLIKQWLPLAVKDGTNLDARSNMMAASIMGATAFQKGLGAVHSLSHPIGAIYDLHHGLLNAIFMPYVLQFNKSVIGKKLDKLAHYLELSDADTLIDWLVELNHQFDIPMDLTSQGVDESKLELIVAQALQDPSTSSNPRACTASDFKTLFLNALYGRVTA